MIYVKTIFAVVLALAVASIPAWGDLVLHWQDNSQVEARYWVLRQAQNERAFRIVADLPANSDTWLDSTTRRNRSYCYMVIGVLNEERSFSNVACKKDTDGRTAISGNIRVGWNNTSGQLTLNLGQ